MFSTSDLNHFFRYALSLSGDEDKAYDLLQDCILRYLEQGRKEGAAYFKVMLRNRFIDQFRRAKREAPLEPEDIVFLEEPCFEDIFLNRDEVQKLLQSMETMERELLFLWAVEGYTFQQCADMMGIPKGTLLSKLHRLKRRLRPKLKEA